jgi:hypothetical protein
MLQEVDGHIGMSDGTGHVKRSVSILHHHQPPPYNKHNRTITTVRSTTTLWRNKNKQQTFSTTNNQDRNYPCTPWPLQTLPGPYYQHLQHQYCQHDTNIFTPHPTKAYKANFTACSHRLHPLSPPAHKWQHSPCSGCSDLRHVPEGRWLLWYVRRNRHCEEEWIPSAHTTTIQQQQWLASLTKIITRQTTKH